MHSSINSNGRQTAVSCLEMLGISSMDRFAKSSIFDGFVLGESRLIIVQNIFKTNHDEVLIVFD